ncbi:MAG: hydantoinase/oxoprolinase family protein [Candidatus Njordarchaeales archaeon]
MKKEYRVGIDIGGTFTDIIALDPLSGKVLANMKIPSTPRQPEKVVINGLSSLARKFGKSVETIIHATTIATNALLGQIGLELPKTALITTKGFRDVLEIGRQRRPELYNLFFTKPKPLIPRRYRLEITERIEWTGRIITPLREEELKFIIQRIKSEKIVSVAVSLLHSYANPIHEKIIKKKLLEEIPELYVSLSSEVDPEYREFERTSTTVVNAVLMPIIHRYLMDLKKALKKLGLEAPILIMQSSGGVSGVDYCAKFPVTIIESGPAAGVVASVFYSSLIKERNLITFDMGGTTAKAGMIIDGLPIITTEYEVGGKIHAGRVIKGSGYPVRHVFIDLAEVSAGGGSIAWVDAGGALRVGPISAGADPGPACYGKGGENPTVTDANLVLGRLNPKYLLGGDMRIYLDLSLKALREKICEVTGMDVYEAAIGVIRIANSIMSKVLRIVSVERGYDPRDFSLIAFGGAGPMHACALAQELEVYKIIVPPSPGLFSALGLLVTDLKHVLSKSIRKNLDEIDPNALEEEFKELETKGIGILKREGVSEDRIVIHRFADMRYWAQGYELLVPISRPIDEKEIRKLRERFHEVHEKTYGYSMRDEEIEIVNIRVECIGLLSKPVIRPSKRKITTRVSPHDYREVFFEGINDFIKTPVFLREKLCPGFEYEGPAIIEQYDSTTVVYPGWRFLVDEYENIIIMREGSL